MKYYNLVFTLFLAIFLSCSKNLTNNTGVDISLLNKKWIVQGSTNTNIRWIEFLYDNTYIIKFENNSIKKNTYSISNNNTQLNLLNFGTITVNNLTVTNFDFTCIINNSSSILSTVATLGTTNSTNTNLLTDHPWNMFKKIDYKSGTPTIKLIPPSNPSVGGLTHVDVIFSPNFTYLATSISKNSTGFDTFYVDRSWQWTDLAETRMKYFDATESGFVNVLRLTTDSLTMKESFSTIDSSYYFLNK